MFAKKLLRSRRSIFARCLVSSKGEVSGRRAKPRSHIASLTVSLMRGLLFPAQACPGVLRGPGGLPIQNEKIHLPRATSNSQDGVRAPPSYYPSQKPFMPKFGARFPLRKERGAATMLNARFAHFSLGDRNIRRGYSGYRPADFTGRIGAGGPGIHAGEESADGIGTVRHRHSR